MTPEGLTIVCTQSGGTPTGELSTGTYYVLERKESDVWIEVADILDGKKGRPPFLFNGGLFLLTS